MHVVIFELKWQELCLSIKREKSVKSTHGTMATETRVETGSKHPIKHSHDATHSNLGQIFC